MMRESGATPTDNPYIFGDPDMDRYRLVTQARLFSRYVREHTREFCGDAVGSILDVGCGEGQLGFVLREIYPAARLVGIDNDPKAIATAQQQAAELGLTNAEFVVGNVEQELPPGPFDLIYASAIFTHLHQPEQMVRAAYTRLNPGGHLWVKDFDPDYFDDAEAQRFLGGSYVKMLKMLLDAIVAIGGHPYGLRELPRWMDAAGFVNVRREREYLKSGGTSDEGVSTFAIGTGAFYNARLLMAKIYQVPEAELVRLYMDVINAEMAQREESNGFSGNVIGEKPRS